VTRTSSTIDAAVYAEVAIPVPVRQTFTYRIPEALAGRVAPGVQVNVPFGPRSAEGFVVSVSADPARADLATIREIRLAGDAGAALPASLLELTRWLADYYLCSWGEAIKAALPGGFEPLRATPKRRRKTAAAADEPAAGFDADVAAGALDVPARGRTLTDEQRAAIEAIAAAAAAPRHQVFLLFGVTGSGKTEVYLESTARVLAAGGQVLAMVPEIALAPQMLAAFRARFGASVVLWHSALPQGQRREAWRRVADGSAAVVVGARSAVFAPFRRLGLVVVDEEHEPAYKQDEAPRYHGRDVAVVRAHRLGIPIVLGSATPSLESFQNVETGKYARLDMPRRIDDRPTPPVHVVPLLRKGDPRPEDDLPDAGRDDDAPGRAGTGILSPPLVRALRERIRRAEQAILFLNRRGHSTVVRCGDCGWVARCPHCDIALTWHADRRELRCHYCAYRSRTIDACPDCAGQCFVYKGIGTQKVESEIARLVPEARLLRMDFDTTRRRGALEKIIETFRLRKADILLGTQMVARGLDFPGVTLVGVINADTQLNLPDFRSAERTFQLLTQVAGRAGRAAPGEVIVQSFAAGHYAIEAARAHDYPTFFAAEMAFRREVDYPPLSRMISLLLDGADEARVIARADDTARGLGEWLRAEAIAPGALELLGPAPRSLSRLKGKFRWHITLKGHDHRVLKRAAEAALALPSIGRGKSAVRLAVDVDPVSLL
jgi:primosomal protein N' (replication factor Y)